VFELSDKPLDTAALRRSLSQPEAGALVVFEGWVRNENEGHAVVSLFYECVPDLCRVEAEKIFAEAREKFGVLGVRVAHRVGQLQVGEVAVWIGVTATHRDAAFQGCRYLIDELKKRLPIWKQEYDVSGGTRWIGL
jgi:molybdopterin synthase catalytic subunit